MIVLACDKVTKSYGIDIILNQITFSVNARHRVGVVGGNGSGKSTLFKIIAGILPMDSGEIYKAKDTTLGYLPQDTVLESENTIWNELMQVFTPLLEQEKLLRKMEQQMADYASMDEAMYSRLLNEYSKLQESFEEQGGYSYESYIKGVLIGLGFSPEEFHMPIPHLSGGQKTRVALAKVLLEKPDLMLLDEPTNHLDLDAIQWLEDYLSAYPGTIMIISHDRYFLDSLCNNILEIENTTCRLYKGNYTSYQKQKSRWIAQREKEYGLQQKEIARQQEIIERYRSQGTERSVRAAESRQKMLDKMEKVENVLYADKVRFSFDADRQSGQDVLMVDSLSKSFEDNLLFHDITFNLRLGDRVAIMGPNGCGKSTLFKIILGQIPPTSGSVKIGTGVEIGYYDQELTSLDPNKTVIEELWDSFPQMTETEIRNALAARLFKGDDVYQPVASLSGGEKSRLILTKLVLANNNFLMLDEPTNHLDMPTREELERALIEFPGTIFMISHDRYFLNKIATRIFVLESGEITEYLGNYDDYINKKREMEILASQSQEETPELTKTALKEQRRRQRLESQKAREEKERLEFLEQEIHRLEQEIENLELEMANPKLYENKEEMLKVQQQYEKAKNKVDELYMKWMDLA
ncbi:MAG: ATP-binding cassette domain-containing protein [Caldicoprobacterales bacterium]|jgi:ATP-binding cassette subfamily F protein 3|nr:ABC-F family ATP-binding cassette domain-containing protein [Clostridiales bacterium]